MNIQEIKKIVLNEKGNLKFSMMNSKTGIDKRYPDLWYEICKNTAFLKDNTTIIERLYVLLNNLTWDDVKCVICKKGYRVFKNFRKGYKTETCSYECGRMQSALTYKKNNPIHHTQTQEFKTKIKEITLKKHGVEYYFQTNVFKESVKQTTLEKHGVESTNSLEEVKQKKKKSWLEKHGVDNPAKSIIQKNKTSISRRINTWENFLYHLTEHNIEPLFTLEEHLHNKNQKYKCLKCNSIFEYLKSIHGLKYCSPYEIRCKKCDPTVSSGEFLINTWLKELGIRTVKLTRYVNNKDLDIFLPDYNLAIEYDGIYWHSDIYKDKNYHLDKTKACKEKGIQLIHVFENEWLNKQNIVKSIILSKIGIYSQRIQARKCEVVRLSSNEYREFTESNHIQGYVPASIRIGLKYDNQIISIMSFGKSRFKKDEIELIRYCALLNTQVIGGFSKLLKHSQLNNIITYCDLRYSDGSGYIKNGFEIVNQTYPNYFYWKQNILKLHSRVEFQKHKLPKVLENFNANLTEAENMYNNGYLRIFDCGNLKLQFKKN